MRALPNLFNKDMIEQYHKKHDKTVPTCAHEQIYYTSLECNNLTNLDVQKFVVNEYVQQYCHAYIDYTSFLSYMEKFFEECTETNENTPLKFYFCGKNLREKSKFAKKIQECFDISYNNQYDKTLKPELLHNNLMDSVLSYVQTIWDHDTAESEAKVYLNNRLFTHKLSAGNLTEKMCSTYLRVPTECTVNKLSWELIALLVSILLFAVCECIMYFVHFGKVVNNKTSMIPFQKNKMNDQLIGAEINNETSNDGKYRSADRGRV